MLRKDVKLGFAIGGVMLAVVVVYVLVVPNNERKSPQLVVDESQPTSTSVGTSGSSSGNNSSSLTKTDAVATDQKPAEVKPSDSGDAKPDNVGESKPLVVISGQQPTTAPSVATKGDVWDLALRDGVIPPSMSSTPTNISTGNDSSGTTDQKPSDASDKSAEKASGKQTSMQTSMLGNQPDAAIVDSGAADATNDAKPADAKLASDTEMKSTGGSHDTTHIVKAGETFSSIAAAAYGDSKNWKLIAAANPTVNPNRLSAGTKLAIPAAMTTASHSAAVASKIDSKSQYQVQASDSLYRISMRLYGTGDHAMKLYEDNKDLIGANPGRLKLGMILKLTDAPSVSTARAS